ncbi:MAG: DUF421 domain-containing protein [Huintestinicola sp.]
MIVVFIRAVILYCILIFSVRLMGKRQIGELQPSELAITILISNIATLPVEDLSIPLITGLLPVLVLVSLDVVMSWITMKSKKLRGMVSGEPVIIISNGRIDQKKLAELRFTTEDLMEAIRTAGYFDLKEVQFAIVETTGKVNVFPKFENRNVTNKDMNIKNNSSDPPSVVVQDGIIMESSLERLGLGKGWLMKILEEHSLAAEDVYIMAAETAAKYTIIERTENNGRGGKVIEKD